MTWPWEKPKLRPGEQVIACPHCQSTRPALPLAQLANAVRRPHLVGVLTGQMYRCRACGGEYDVTPDGVHRSMAPKVEPTQPHTGPVPQVGERMPVPKARP